MLVHMPWLADDFLLRQGFTIVDPGPGLRRTAARDELSFDLDPACRCEDCPPFDHPNYRRLDVAASTEGER